MANARTRFDALASYLQQYHAASPGQLYGKRCLFLDGEPFIVLHRESVAFRVSGRALTHAMAMTGSTGFDPLKPDEPPHGRPGWVLVPTAHFLAWDRLAIDSIRCIRLAQVQNVSWQPPPPTPAPAIAAASTTKSLSDRVAGIMKTGFGFGLFKNDN